MIPFNERASSKKGKVGERLVDAWLRDQGYVPYAPVVENKAHPFDRIVASENKREIFVAECKTKPARTEYHDTGIDVRHYNDYKHIMEKYGLGIFLFFVDEDKREIYGGYLAELDCQCHEEKPDGSRLLSYPLVRGGIRYFPLSAMLPVCQLTDDEVAEIKPYTRRNKRWEPKPAPACIEDADDVPF